MTPDDSEMASETLADNEQLLTEVESRHFAADEGIAREGVYLIVQHHDACRVVDVPKDGQLIVGRDLDADIVVAETKVSRAHAAVIRRGQFLILQDKNSTNGTTINGSTLRNGERRLAGGDVVRIGSAEITVAAAATASVAPRSARGRLDLALDNSEAALLLRIELPPSPPAGALDTMAACLNSIAIVEERSSEGQYAALIQKADLAQAHQAIEMLKRQIANIHISTAAHPETGSTIDKLWRAAGSETSDEETAVAAFQGNAIASPNMVKLYKVAKRLAQTDTTVLITGETGTGKEVLASFLHNNSPRVSEPYVRLNCASLPENLLVSELFGHEKGAFTGAERRKVGYFEAASGGSLLLDEIGELSASAQVKLLRVLENRTVIPVGSTREIPVDVRVICATHRDLSKEIAEGRFREDLFYRVSAFKLHIPPLRERNAEIGLLADLFLRELSERAGHSPPQLSSATSATLATHPFRGNVRELRNAIEHAFVMRDGDCIEPQHLPPNFQQHGASPSVQLPHDQSGGHNVRAALAQIERASIVKALENHGGNQTRAAKQLGLSRRALIYKMGKYEIKRARDLKK
jgi:two-component system, NtrC family, response regulator AtoC